MSELGKAILAFQKESPKLQKNAINPHFKNRYVSLDTLMGEVTPLLNKHGLIFQTFPTGTAVEPALEYVLSHPESGEERRARMPLMLSKSDPQGQGSAITYARRYSLMAVLGLVADEDDDGAKASKAPQKTEVVRDRPMNASEITAMNDAIKRKGANRDLLFAAAGVEGELPTAVQARKISELLHA